MHSPFNNLIATVQVSDWDASQHVWLTPSGAQRAVREISHGALHTVVLIDAVQGKKSVPSCPGWLHILSLALWMSNISICLSQLVWIMKSVSADLAAQIFRVIWRRTYSLFRFGHAHSSRSMELPHTTPPNPLKRRIILLGEGALKSQNLGPLGTRGHRMSWFRRSQPETLW